MADTVSATAGALPPLREDIRLFPGPSAANGAPTWSLYDPALHRFLRIGRLEFEILVRWGLGRATSIADAVSSATTLRATEDDVMEVLRFASRARLLRLSGPAAAQAMAGEVEARKLSPAMWLLKNYLFIRVRLIDPDRFLASAASSLGWMFSAGFVRLIACLSLLGFYLIGRQWETYAHSFTNYFSIEGAVQVGGALAFAKVIHEFGHGLVAKRLGCRVPGMGVALLVLWPMAWTDVTDAWRLTTRHQRLLIDAAGVIAELVLAVVASLAWSILPDGPARGAAFLLSSSGWIMTLVVNASPLMRFDGYFLLSDWLNEPNLQERSFAIGRWWLRRLLFGFADASPETLPPARRRFLTGYAFACWIYRFTLFMGIAVLVYHLAFKLLGLFLMAVEVGWFIVRPIIAELRIWPVRLRRGEASSRAWVTLAVLGAGIALLAVPWRATVSAPGLLRAGRQISVLTAEPGQVLSVSSNGSVVAAGQALLAEANPDTAYAAAQARAEIDGLKAKLAGQAFDREGAQDLPVSWQQLEAAMARLRDAEARTEQLVVRAPFAGRLDDVPRDLAAGIWVPRREPLGILVDPTAVRVEAMVNEADVARIRAGAVARFAPENGEAPIKLTVADISPGAEPLLTAAELASVNGGGVPVRKGQDGALKPEAAVYRVSLKPLDADFAMAGVRRGTVRIDADPVSLAGGLWRRAWAVVMREAGL